MKKLSYFLVFVLMLALIIVPATKIMPRSATANSTPNFDINKTGNFDKYNKNVCKKDEVFDISSETFDKSNSSFDKYNKKYCKKDEVFEVFDINENANESLAIDNGIDDFDKNPKKRLLNLSAQNGINFLQNTANAQKPEVNSAQNEKNSTLPFEVACGYKSALLMDKLSGKILVEANSHQRLPIASVTKLMTILLTLEKIDAGEISLDDTITVTANASGMGGSQVFLDANADYKLSELLKSVIVASANDSSVALAEHISGSEANFVRLMNERASELGLTDTHYVNCTGLPSSEGYSCAYDQAVILAHVLNYPVYGEFSHIWMQDFVHPSGRTTSMTNTNRLSRFYEGCLGGKTGSTNQAKYCLAVGAKRADMQLVSVVLGAENSKGRFKLASDLLNYGFENYKLTPILTNADLANKQLKIKGMNRYVDLKLEREFSLTTKIDEQPNFSLNFNLPTMLDSVKENQIVGNVEIVLDGVVVDTINILSCQTKTEASLWDYFKEIIKE